MMYVEIAIVAALIVLNGLLAMSELAVVSARPARLKMLIEQGVNGSRRALALASDPGRFLSTVQIGITLVGILAGAYSGATLGHRLSGWLAGMGLGTTVADYIGFGVVVTVITYFSLIVGELVPKQIALRNPERVACKVAPAMTLLARIAAPAVWLLSFSGKAVLSLFGGGGASEGRITEEEIKTLVAEAEGAGVLEPQERAMISAVLRLGDRPVRAVMTPRHEVDMINVGDDVEMIRRRIVDSKHTSLPVYDAEVDAVIGIIQAKDLLGRGSDLSVDDVRAIVRPAPVVPDTMDALDVVDLFKETGAHIGLVHDEYGDFEGVVTASDILQSIVGELPDEGSEEAAIVERPDGSLLVSGSAPVDEVADRLHLPLPAGRKFHTIAGLVLAELGHFPDVCETVDIEGWRFEVIDLDGRRIDKLLISRIAVLRRARA
jgi:putative hemolysin